MLIETKDSLDLELAEPVWEIARLFPAQGDWSEEAYLELANRTNKYVELSEGCLEVLHLPHPPRTKKGEPSWDIACLFPRQGDWSESDYLSLPSNERLELSNGYIEVKPIPTATHQIILAYLYGLLLAFVKKHFRGATVLFSSLPVRLGPGKLREPDILVMLAEHADRRHDQYWERPDLVMEIVSPGSRDLDLVTKRREYARAGIAEYWIVDPQNETVTVLTLNDRTRTYLVHGVYKRGMKAESTVLAGFKVNASKIWKAAGS